MNEPLPDDVVERLVRDFGDRADSVAAQLLAFRGIGRSELLSDRVVRCLIVAARGDERRVQQLIALAHQDWRDVIVAGEYDSAGRQIRDLSSSFQIDLPERFWAGQIVAVMVSRGYRVSSIETRPATVGPFDYGCDFNEGRALFVGPLGTLGVEKRDRKWLLQSDDPDFPLYRASHLHSDEAAFRDAVSCYLLARRSGGDSDGSDPSAAAAQSCAPLDTPFRPG